MPNPRILIRIFAIVTVLLFETSSNITVYAHEPIIRLREKHVAIVNELDSESRKLPKLEGVKAIGSNRNYIDNLLKAGQCDKALEIMTTVSKLGNSSNYCFVDHYCFTMAIAGTAKEALGNVKNFRNTSGVRFRLRDQGCDFETLCDVAIAHGNAIRHGVEGDIQSAGHELEKIASVKAFKLEMDEINCSVGFEVFHVAGPKRCIEFFQIVAGGEDTRKFKSLVGKLVRWLNIDNDSGPLLDYLAMEHPDLFLIGFNSATEGSFALTGNAQQEFVDQTLAKLPQFDESTVVQIKAKLANSKLVNEKVRNQFSSDCLKWLKSASNGDQRGLIRQLSPWLIANAKIDELVELAQAYKSNDKFKYSTVVTNAINSVPWNSLGDSKSQLLDVLPPPEEIYGNENYKADGVRLLARSNRLETAKNWIAAIYKPKSVRLNSENHLEIYRYLYSTKNRRPSDFAEKLVARCKKAESYSRNHHGYLMEMISDIVEIHNLETALTVAKSLANANLLNSTPFNACLRSFFENGHTEHAIQLISFLTAREKSLERLESLLGFSNLNDEQLEIFVENFPSSLVILNEKTSRAIRVGNRALAMKIQKRVIEEFGKTTLENEFVKAGWQDSYFALTKRTFEAAIQSRDSKEKMRDCTLFVTDSIFRQHGLAPTVRFIKKHFPDARNRLWLFNSVAPSIKNPSHLVWEN